MKLARRMGPGRVTGPARRHMNADASDWRPRADCSTIRLVNGRLGPSGADGDWTAGRLCWF